MSFSVPLPPFLLLSPVVSLLEYMFILVLSLAFLVSFWYVFVADGG